MKPLHIGITGASGFIGQHLVRAALRAGHDVTGFVRQRSAPQIDGANYVEVGEEVDAGWENKLAGLNIIVHLAGRAHVLKELERDPLAAFRRANVEGSSTLAKAACRNGVDRLVFISSIGVNGVKTSSEPFRAADVPNPTSPYAISKYEAEQELKGILGGGGTELCVLRPPMVYGRLPKGNLHRLLQLVNIGLPLPFGGINNRRTLVSASNLADAILLCAVSPAAAGRVFLVGDGELSTTKLVKWMAQGIGQPAKLVTIPRGLVRYGASVLGLGRLYTQLFEDLWVDSEPLKQIGWVPQVPLQNGILDMAMHWSEFQNGNRK